MMGNDLTSNQEEQAVAAPGATAAAVPPISPAPVSPNLLTALRARLRGDLGQIPVFFTLLVVAVFFQIATGGAFLTARNLTELIGEIITIGSIALGAVLVLLIGEIDLSLAAISNLSGATMVILASRHGWDAPAALLAGLVVGAIVGAVNGFFVSVVRVPSFIVTLAGLIGYQGLLLRIMVPQTTIPLRNETLTAFATTYLPAYLGIGLPVLGLGVYALSLLRNRAQRQQRGLPVPSNRDLAIRIGVAALVIIVVIVLFESYLGFPLPAMILLALIVLFWLILGRTRFGRHTYAVGGSAEAARRAGINVTTLRIAIFTLAGILAAVGGILQASRAVSASAAVEPTLLLNAIAAPVIGGVSLFGGRGSVWSVVLGSLIVGSLINGLALTGKGTDVEQMVEGAVLLIAVIIDALLRRRNATGFR
ncbi:MAG: sugar ABC transporter permease [Thermomicrobiales bacterium]